MSSTESIATPALPTSPTTCGWSSRSRGASPDRTRPTAPSARPRDSGGRTRSSLPRVPKPPYWRIVHRRLAYIVARGPRTNGSMPGIPPTMSSASRSSAVYSGLTAMPSGVCHTSVSGSAPRSSELADARHGLSAGSGASLLLTAHPLARRSQPTAPVATILAVHRRPRTRAGFELRHVADRAARSGTERCVVSVRRVGRGRSHVRPACVGAAGPTFGVGRAACPRQD